MSKLLEDLSKNGCSSPAAFVSLTPPVFSPLVMVRAFAKAVVNLILDMARMCVYHTYVRALALSWISFFVMRCSRFLLGIDGLG